MADALEPDMREFEEITSGSEDYVTALVTILRRLYELDEQDVLRNRVLVSEQFLVGIHRESSREEEARQLARARMRDLEFAWATFLARGMEQGVIPEADARLLTRAVLGLHNSVWHWYRPRGPLALEAGLREHGVRIEDLELVLGTHHHMDHVGLIATIQRRSDARVAVLDGLADYASDYEGRTRAERSFSSALMATHGVPDQVIADNEGFWEYISTNSEGFTADLRLIEGDVIRAGDRDLRVVERPGHSTTDTLFVDDEDGVAFVGDHVLARISSNTEIYPGPGEQDMRPRARLS